MDGFYRQKLLDWWCSMALLGLVCSLSALLNWNRVLVMIDLSGTAYRGIEWWIGPAAGGFASYPMFFPPLAFWHLCDFLERDRGPNMWRGWLATYRRFAALLLFLAPLAAVSGSGGIGLTGDGGVFCYKHGDFGDFLYHPCLPPGSGDTLMVLIGGPLMILACASKALTALVSHRKPNNE